MDKETVKEVISRFHDSESADSVQVMVNLGFPFWGFLILWFATWTSQLVNNYSDCGRGMYR
ncbi:purine-cytosine permease-like protein [Desulfohalotomaculum tongense]|uniref:hypothetical protein n=1 Tax=Desulforadius tongensis TaxID=1216062 RepID=UPI0019586E75|nr:hypothetical protein [Desulforadius tongensis]MBM7855068.1 purine-cytosine permease-like protein [Desulforadius tongensis]